MIPFPLLTVAAALCRRRLRRCLLACLGLLTSLDAVPMAAQPSRRHFASDSVWTQRWILGADSSTELFIEPRQLVVSGASVLVLDAGTRELLVIDAASGRLHRRVAARGTAPGEFRRPSLVTATPDGYAILDQETARLNAYTRAGELVWDAIVEDAARIAGVCALPAGRVLLTYARTDALTTVMDTTGRVLARWAMPWIDPVPSSDFARAHALSSAGPDGRCALTPYFGGHWALVGSLRGTVALADYIERGARPRITSTRKVLERTASHVLIEGDDIATTPPIANGVLRRRDTVIVVGGMTRDSPRRLLDYYDGTSGRYLYSRKLPTRFTAVAVGDDGTFYGSLITDQAQLVVALRPMAATGPGVPGGTRARRPRPAIGPSRGSR